VYYVIDARPKASLASLPNSASRLPNISWSTILFSEVIPNELRPDGFLCSPWFCLLLLAVQRKRQRQSCDDEVSLTRGFLLFLASEILALKAGKDHLLQWLLVSFPLFTLRCLLCNDNGQNALSLSKEYTGL